MNQAKQSFAESSDPDGKNTADMTLDEIVHSLAAKLPYHAAFDGWNIDSLYAAADELGIDHDIAKLAYETSDIGGNNLPMKLVISWITYVDAQMHAMLPPEKLNAMKIRDRITALLIARLEIAAPHREAQRRAMSLMTLPGNITVGLKTGWHSADLMWRMAGDKATDYNHYTKRAILSSIYTAILLNFINDDSEDFADTRAFVDRRIDNVMQFEKAKAGFLSRTENKPSLSRFLGRLRYPEK